MKKLLTVAAMAVMLCLTGLGISGTAFAERCVDNGDGTVTDNGTRLMWQKASLGPMNFHSAMNYVFDLSVGGHTNWRLPHHEQLTRLYSSPCKSLLDVKADNYWSSVTHVPDSSFAWVISFANGSPGITGKRQSFHARAVRAAK